MPECVQAWERALKRLETLFKFVKGRVYSAGSLYLLHGVSYPQGVWRLWQHSFNLGSKYARWFCRNLLARIILLYSCRINSGGVYWTSTADSIRALTQQPELEYAIWRCASYWKNPTVSISATGRRRAGPCTGKENSLGVQAIQRRVLRTRSFGNCVR